MDSQPLQRCDNCMKDFPQSKIATHFGYCRRNIKKCQVCRQLFDINFKEEHEEEFHRKDKCPHCSKQFASGDFKQHERKCTLKPKFCEYCDLNVPVSGFQTHFKACQSRTKPCSKCNKPIMNKDYLIHSVSCDGVKELPKQPASYQEHILQQQQKRQEQYNQFNKASSREKPQLKPKEKNYIGIASNNNRNGVQQKIVYEPKIINPPRPQLEKKQSNKYVPSSRVEPKQYVNPIKKITTNLVPTNPNVPKRQETKLIGFKNSPVISNQQKRPSGSRQANRPQISSKQVFKPETIKPQIKESKSIERNGLIKAQEVRDKYTIPNIPKPQQIKQGFNFRIPAPKPREQVVRQKSPQVKNDYIAKQFSMAEFGLSPEQQMMQEILMQSAKDQKGKKIITPTGKPPSKNENKYNDIPFIEGQDIMNQSFIEKQKAIQQEFTRKNKGRR